MHPKIETKFKKLEKLSAALLAELDAMDQAQLDFIPDSGNWSIQNVLEHVLAAEKAVLSYLLKKNQAEELPSSGLAESWRGIALTAALRSPLKFQAPRVLRSPQRFASLQDLLTDWKAQREALNEFLEVLPNDRIDRIIFKHPIVGYFNILQTLDFLYEHLNRHARQIRRLHKHQSFPDSIA